MNILKMSILCILIQTIAVHSQELTGSQIIKKVNEVMNPDSYYAKAKMTITTTSKKKRTFVYDSWSKGGGEKSLIRYLKPRRVVGQATLMLNHSDDIWVYFPRTQRIRKLATHAKKQKIQGSDFSYEDMGSGDAFVKEFISLRLKDEKLKGKECFQVELRRRPESNVFYSKIRMWILKNNFVPIVIDYYDDKDQKSVIKTLEQYNIRIIQGIPTAMNMVMKNRIDNSVTEMEFLEVRYNMPLPDNMFTERELKK